VFDFQTAVQVVRHYR